MEAAWAHNQPAAEPEIKVPWGTELKNWTLPPGFVRTCYRWDEAGMVTCSQRHPKIKSEHPGLSVGDTAKELGEMWSEQSAEDKQLHEQKSG